MNPPDDSVSTVTAMPDHKRVLWGAEGLPPHLGIYPGRPDIIVRQFPKEFAANRPFMRSRRASVENFSHAQTEFQHLRGAGVTVLGVMATYGQDCFGRWRTYAHTSRLIGEHPNPKNPEHESQLLRLGRALLKYYQGARIRGRYLVDVDALEQYTYGQPVSQSTAAKQLYLHDVEPITLEVPDPNHQASPDVSIMNVYRWVKELPTSSERRTLLTNLYVAASQPGNFYE